ncbi:MAG: ABC transporter substrate-binding protein, partial [Firmicutes bacterium]|nr:ABC transporter substrate-binding protein [Bacillota bacterium]
MRRYWNSLLLVLCIILISASVFAAPVKRGGYVAVTEGKQGVLVQNFNPFSPNALQSTGGNFYETLVLSNNYTGQIQPWLAESYSWSEDLLTLTFKLRDHVYWNDGNKFTADDVVFTIMLSKDNPALDLGGIWQNGLQEVKKLDDYTVQLVFDQVNVPVLVKIASIYIVP